MTIDYYPAKSLLTSQKNDGFNGANYNMNLYRGCNHGCIYCDSRSECYQIDNFDKVRAKENALAILEDELQRKRKKGIVSFGAMNDPYNSFERAEQLTRGALMLLSKYQFGASILTKSKLIARDIDVFKEININAPMAARMTITTFDDNLCRLIEQSVCPTSERFGAIKEISSHGVLTGVHLGPILPFINDNTYNIRMIVRQAAECNAKFIYPYFGVTLRKNQQLYFYQKLDELFPGVKQQYIKTFGNSYECISPNSKELWHALVEECEKHHLLYRVKDIIKTIHESSKRRQVSIFDFNNMH